MRKTTQLSRSAKKAEKDSGNITVYAPYDSVAVPSSAMLANIERKLQILERAGVDTTVFRENKTYKRRYSEAKQMLRGLMTLIKENGLRDVQCKTSGWCRWCTGICLRSNRMLCTSWSWCR